MKRVTDKKFLMDTTLLSNLNLLKNAIQDKWDGVLLVDGMEGAGKSVFAAMLSYYLGYNPKKNKSNFGIDNIVWTADQFEVVVNQAKVGSVILWDEFITAGLGTEAMTKLQNKIKKYFTLIRNKRLYVVLLAPYIFILGAYFAVARSRALFHVFSPNGKNRGYFKFYDYEQKKDLYFFGKKRWKYTKNYSFIGYSKIRNISELGIDEEEYNQRKEKATKGIFEEKKTKYEIWKNRFYRSLHYIKNNTDIKWKEIAVKLGLDDISWHTIQVGYSDWSVKNENQIKEVSEQKNFKNSILNLKNK